MKLLEPEKIDIRRGPCPEVSFIIRARNEEALIGRCLESIAAQKTKTVGEVIVVDSGSTDRTLEIVREFPSRIIEIDRHAFTYSSALNRGIEASHGRFVVPISAHVIPEGTGWLATLLECMNDVRVAGAHGRELPWPDADLYERLRLGPIFRPWRIERSLDALGDEDDPNDERLYFFSNAAACIRRELWERHPFAELPYAEDLEWARWALRSGYRIVYEPEARAFHSHRESLWSRASREFSYHAAKCIIFKTPHRRVRTCLASLVESVFFVLRASRRVGIPSLGFWAIWALVKWVVFCFLALTRRVPAPVRARPDGNREDSGPDDDRGTDDSRAREREEATRCVPS